MAREFDQRSFNDYLWAARGLLPQHVANDAARELLLCMLGLRYSYELERLKLTSDFGELDQKPRNQRDLAVADSAARKLVKNYSIQLRSLFEQDKKKDIEKNLNSLLGFFVFGVVGNFEGDAAQNNVSNIFNSISLGDIEEKRNILSNLVICFQFNMLHEEPFSKPSSGEMLQLLANGTDEILHRFELLEGRKGGGSFTPSAVSQLIANLVAPSLGEEIYDPACGFGGLLAQCFNYVKSAGDQDSTNSAQSCQLFGQDNKRSASTPAILNLHVHGAANCEIRTGDIFSDPEFAKDNVLKKFDVVVAAPPMAVKNWAPYQDMSLDPYQRFQRGVPPKTNGDYAFISHMIESMDDQNGRMAVLVPHGVLFRGSKEGDIRRELIDENLLDAVIGLPAALHYGTSIPLAILVFKKQREEKTVLFIDASGLAEKAKKGNVLNEAHIEKISEVYKNRTDEKEFSKNVSTKEIAENDYVLTIPRYVSNFEVEKINLDDAEADWISMSEALAEANQELSEKIKAVKKLFK